MFRYIENKDRTFLFGAYRGEKSQLDWILGEKTQRYEKLYNIRFNKDLFSPLIPQHYSLTLFISA